MNKKIISLILTFLLLAEIVLSPRGEASRNDIMLLVIAGAATRNPGVSRRNEKISKTKVSAKNVNYIFIFLRLNHGSRQLKKL